jgi:hypothetical protein
MVTMQLSHPIYTVYPLKAKRRRHPSLIELLFLSLEFKQIKKDVQLDSILA